MNLLKSLTGVVNLPDARLNFHLSFNGEEPQSGEKREKKTGSIMDEASKLPLDLQELLVDFAEYLAKKAEK